MATYRKVHVRCKFGRGGFAHERVFWIDAPGGGSYRGLAYIDYCHSTDGSPLSGGEPPIGQLCQGLVVAKIIDEPSSAPCTIQVPDGELCDIDPSIIEEIKSHVSI